MLDNKGNMYIEDDEIVELLLANKCVKILPKNKDSFNHFAEECRKMSMPMPFKMAQVIDEISWPMPHEYANIDIAEYIAQRHNLNSIEQARVNLELTEFSKRGLTDLLRFLIYLVTELRRNNIIYGVGRGSSIASFVLYLLGVHRINSLKYNLDLKEFLK
jgi:DNA polymerase III alpha subunit